jgi:DNA-binding transcriptional LysR family regulator
LIAPEILRSFGSVAIIGHFLSRRKMDISNVMVQKKRTVAATNLDIDILRTLVTAEELGGMNRAAERVGRSQSAVSQQIRKLEEKAGQQLFRKQGRGLVLTEAGEMLLGYAQRILALNDEAVAALRGAGLEGAVRFGLPGDFAETWLPSALGQFKRAHPMVRVEASVDRNSVLVERLGKGLLDLALIFGSGTHAGAERLATLPMVWIGSVQSAWEPTRPIPLVLFEAPCLFRKAGIAALDAARIPWRIAFTSPSLAGLWAAVDAGLGISPRTATNLPKSLKILSGLPKLPAIDLSLHDGGRALTPATLRLKEILLETLPSSLSPRRHAGYA